MLFMSFGPPGGAIEPPSLPSLVQPNAAIASAAPNHARLLFRLFISPSTSPRAHVDTVYLMRLHGGPGRVKPRPWPSRRQFAPCRLLDPRQGRPYTRKLGHEHEHDVRFSRLPTG